MQLYWSVGSYWLSRLLRPQDEPVTANLVESGWGSFQLHKQNKVQVPDVLDSLSVLCCSRAPNLGICTTTLFPRSQDISIFLDKYLAVGYFPPPVNFYLQFKAAHVQNLKHHSSMQGWHLFPSFQMPKGWVELLFIDSFLPATSLFATFYESADPFTSLQVVLFSQWTAFSNGFVHAALLGVYRPYPPSSGLLL